VLYILIFNLLRKE